MLLKSGSKNDQDGSNNIFLNDCLKKHSVISSDTVEHGKIDSALSVNMNLGVKTLMKSPEGIGNRTILELGRDPSETVSYPCGGDEAKHVSGELSEPDERVDLETASESIMSSAQMTKHSCITDTKLGSPSSPRLLMHTSEKQQFLPRSVLRAEHTLACNDEIQLQALPRASIVIHQPMQIDGDIESDDDDVECGSVPGLQKEAETKTGSSVDWTAQNKDDLEQGENDESSKE